MLLDDRKVDLPGARVFLCSALEAALVWGGSGDSIWQGSPDRGEATVRTAVCHLAACCLKFSYGRRNGL